MSEVPRDQPSMVRTTELGRGRRSGPWRLGLPGLITIGACYGFGRYGYGLFLPQIRQEFGLSLGVIGAIASAGYGGTLLALALVNLGAARWGPSWFVGAGGACAGAGMLMIGLSLDTETLLLGVFLSGVAPGLVWAPYSDAVADMVAEPDQGRALSLISTGTTFGVLVAGPSALLAIGAGWHLVWVLAAIGTLMVTGWNVAVLPHRARPRNTRDQRRRLLGRPQTARLFTVAFSAGLVGATYWTFAGEAVSTSNHTGLPTAPLLWTLIGIFGITGVLTGTIVDRFGLQSVYVTCQVCLVLSFLTLSLAPANWVSASVSAILFGPAFMTVAALLSVWNSQVFPDQPSRGFSVTVIFLSVGSIAGPAVLGWVADHSSISVVFLVTSVLAALTAAARPRISHRVAENGQY